MGTPKSWHATAHLFFESFCEIFSKLNVLSCKNYSLNLTFIDYLEKKEKNNVFSIWIADQEIVYSVLIILVINELITFYSNWFRKGHNR